MKAHLLTAVATAVIASGLVACSSGPSTREEVCEAYDDLGRSVMGANGFFDNAVFSNAEDLADVADRYEGTPALDSDAKKLNRIADSDSTSGSELMNAATTIANLCGHPLGLG